MSLTRSLLATVLAGLVLAALVATLPESATVEAQTRNPNVPASGCSVLVSETVSSPQVRICEEAEITVTGVVSAPQALPLHVVFLIAKHLYMFDHLEDVKKAARDMVNALEFTEDTKVGVVTLSVESETEQDLTNKRSTVLGAINRIRLDLGVATRQFDWMYEAEGLLAEARKDSISPREIIITFSTGCAEGFEHFCTAMKSASSRVQGRDIEVIGICKQNIGLPRGGGGLPPMPINHCDDIRGFASRGSYYDLRSASRVQAHLVGIEDEAKSVTPELVTLMEYLAPGFEYVAGSGQPAPKVKGNRLQFEWEDSLPGETVTASYRAKSLQLGMHPLREENSEFFIEDSLERVSSAFLVPTRTLEVIPCEPPTPVPSLTPTDVPTPTGPPQPTNTPTAEPTAIPSATPTTAPSPTSLPGTVYLPALWKNLCKQAVAHTDVVLVIDASSSMDEAIGDTSRLEAARAAARRFVSLLDLEGGDHAAIVSFNSEAKLLSALSQNRDELESAVAGIQTNVGTRMDLALYATRAELEGVGGAEDNNKVVVLMTDGRPDGGSEEATLDEADMFGAATIYAIGFGSGINADFLLQIASGPETYLEAPGAAELESVYEAIAGELPCPGGVVLKP